MRIIQLASGDLWAGAEVQLYHLACHLVRQDGVILRVVLLNYGQLEKSLKQQGIDVLVLNEANLGGLSILRQFKAIASKFKPDVIHTHRSKENVIGGIVGKLVGCKSVRTVHGASELSSSGFSLRRFVFGMLDGLAGRFLQKKIISVSEELAIKLEKHYPKSKIATIENSIDPGYVQERSNEKVEFDIPVGQFNIAFIGRFVSVKRVDIFYEIAKKIINNTRGRENIHFYMLGDGPLWQDINEKIARDGLQERVHLAGFVNNTAPYLKIMQLLIFTSDHEGLPMTLLEAMALRVPVMSRNLTTIRQVLCDGKCGLMINKDDTQEYITAIESYNESPECYFALRKQALDRVINRYSIHTNITKYMKIYQSLHRLK